MQTNYELSLTTPSVTYMPTNMDREQRIRELLQAVTTLLASNKSMGEKMDKVLGENEALKTKLEKVEDQLEDLRRDKFGSKNEKHPGRSKPVKGTTKQEEEDDYINNGGQTTKPDDDTDEDEVEPTDVEPKERKERDLTNRPDIYKTMHADLCVIHDCNIEKLKEQGLEFIRYTRPVDQFDRISLTRQDRYLYAWVRDKDGNEFSVFVPNPDDNSGRCMLINESQYDKPCIVPHTSCTGNMLSDLCVNRFQYAISTGREMYRMINEKMCMSKQTILNWLAAGSKLLDGSVKSLKKRLLKKDTVLYCDETWVDTKIKAPDGTFHYRKRYMWVLVNLTTNVCHYLFGSRKRKVIEEFLADFQGTLMTDAYAAYKYFNKLDECSHLCCWAHVRRIFVSALENYRDIKAKEYIELIGMLYKIEVECILLHRTEDEVATARKLESVPVLNELKQKAEMLLARCEKKEETVSSKLQQALKYMINNWSELVGYVKIGNVYIDNNVSERAIRPFTNLRKSFGGFSSEDGGRTAAIYLSIVETCKLLKKPPLDFFKSFFSMIVDGRRDFDLMTEELLC